MKNRLPVLLALLLSSVLPRAARAEGASEAKRQLGAAADFLASLDAEAYEEVSRDIMRRPRGAPRTNARYLASREAALESVYNTLAALEYKEALEAGLPTDASAETEASFSTLKADTEALAINPETLVESSWWSAVNTYINSDPPRRARVTAVAAVRGGRKVPTEADKKAAKLQKSLKEVSRSLDGQEEAAKRAQLIAERGGIYRKLAQITASQALPSEEAARPRPAPKAAAPASAAELSPKAVYQRAGPAVVLITCFGADGNGELGTGSVIDEAGHVLTNAHVVIRSSTKRPFDKIRVYFKPEKVSGNPKVDLVKAYEARVLNFDRALDLALLELDDKPAELTVLPIGDADSVEAGEPVVAIGHPEQGGLWTLTTGVVSTVISDLGGVEGKDAFQTDASINRGNSGGPLINRRGALIGVNTSMARKAPDGLTITSVNFSVKSSVAKKWLDGSGKAAYLVADASPAAEPAAPARTPEPAPEPAKPAAAKPAAAAEPEAPKAAIVTPPKPFKIEDMLAREMAEMDDLEKEMHGEVERRRESIEAMGAEQQKR